MEYNRLMKKTDCYPPVINEKPFVSMENQPRLPIFWDFRWFYFRFS